MPRFCIFINERNGQIIALLICIILCLNLYLNLYYIYFISPFAALTLLVGDSKSICPIKNLASTIPEGHSLRYIRGESKQIIQKLTVRVNFKKSKILHNFLLLLADATGLAENFHCVICQTDWFRPRENSLTT